MVRRLLPRCATALGRNDLADAIRCALAEHAPRVLELDPDATWSKELEQRVMASALGPDSHASDRRWARARIGGLLAHGARVSGWDVPVRPPGAGKARPSRLSRFAARQAALAQERRDCIARRLDELVACEDSTVIVGALVLAAVDYSAVLCTGLLAEIPALTSRHATGIQRARGFAWLDIPLGAPSGRAHDDTGKRPRWGSVRRWFLDPVSVWLAQALGRGTRRRETDAATCIAAALEWLGLAPATFSEVVRSARHWWAPRLDQLGYEYATIMPYAPSLPSHAWEALLTGRRPARPGHTEVEHELPKVEPTQATTVRPSTSLDRSVHLRAVADLTRLLRTGRGGSEMRASKSQVLSALDAWGGQHGEVGGWVHLLAGWTRSIVESSTGRVSSRLGIPGLLRYHEAIAKPFVELMYDLPPDVLLDPDEEADEALATRLEALAFRLEGRQSASPVKAGLTSFLDFVRAAGGPDIELDSSWRIVCSPSNVRANLLTPSEYTRLLAWLARQGPPESFAVRRNQVITILAYRTGARWEELQTRRLDDVQIRPLPTDVTALHGWLSIGANAHFRGKTRSSIRRLPLELLLTPGELVEVAGFVGRARTLGGAARPGSDFLFAASDALQTPPDCTPTRDVIQHGMRSVSGDTGLVFHDLRHSAASFIGLRMLDHPAAPLMPETWIREGERVAGKTWAAGRGSYAERALGRSAIDGSRLVALARVLGHIDPATSMRHYVHLYDVVHATAVAPFAIIPNDVLARLAGVHLASIHRRRSRARWAPGASTWESARWEHAPAGLDTPSEIAP